MCTWKATDSIRRRTGRVPQFHGRYWMPQKLPQICTVVAYICIFAVIYGTPSTNKVIRMRSVADSKNHNMDPDSTNAQSYGKCPQTTGPRIFFFLTYWMPQKLPQICTVIVYNNCA